MVLAVLGGWQVVDKEGLGGVGVTRGVTVTTRDICAAVFEDRWELPGWGQRRSAKAWRGCSFEVARIEV